MTPPAHHKKRVAPPPNSSSTKATTLKDIADSLGVSVMTVSNILRKNPKAKYRKDTIREVYKKAELLGYQVNRSAQAMRQGKTGVIGFVTMNTLPEGTLTNAVAYAFITGMSLFLTERSKHVGIVELKELETPNIKDLPATLKERFYDGLVIGHGIRKPLAKAIEKIGVPSIFYDGGIFGPYNCICRNEEFATKKTMEKLLEAGHKKIAYRHPKALWGNDTTDTTKHYSVALRSKTYETIMKANRLRPIFFTGGTMESLRREIQDSKCTAIILDSHCPYTEGALFSLNLSIPADVSVASIAIESSIIIHPHLFSGMGYDRLATGKLAANMILRLIDSSEPQPSLSIEPHWEERGTIAPPSL